ncbi:MAG: hypothetical protein ACTS77_02510 [Arsenophonus sp. NC-TX2-MAG3]
MVCSKPSCNNMLNAALLTRFYAIIRNSYLLNESYRLILAMLRLKCLKIKEESHRQQNILQQLITALSKAYKISEELVLWLGSYWASFQR